MPENIKTYLKTTSLYIFYGLLAYMPLHIFISTVVGVQLNALEIAKTIKDIVLFFGFGMIFVASLKKEWFKGWIRNPAVLLIIVYAIVTSLTALFKPTDQDAEILGVVYNLRFLLFFLYGWLLIKNFEAKQIQKAAIRIVLSVGVVVVSFGLLQYFILPNDALIHLGFVRENGVLPAFFIDDKPDLERVMSTVRDPNSLGAYLLIIGSLISARLLAVKDKRSWFWLYAVSTLLCLYLTFSRSAWLGLSFSGLVFFILYARTKSKKVTHAINTGALIVLVAIVLAVPALFVARDSYFVKNIIFHADESTTEETPNQLRVRFWQESLDKAIENPEGTGPGSVGVVSAKDNLLGGRLTENYYLQILGEVGFIGLTLFLGIMMIVATKLYNGTKQSELVEVALLASFAGISLSGLFNHIWINEAVAYTWWGLAGLYEGVKISGSSVVDRGKE